VAGASFTGLELCPDAISKGTANGYNILNRSVEEHARINGSMYDVVTSFQVLEHVTKIYDFINSRAKCVKTG
jgi:2-polyprenyl-3-methyl-5-hydroxy-6-metoxy-1,4-benzoquinol methylase